MAGEYGLIPEVGGGGGVGASAGVMVVWVTVIDIYIYISFGWVGGGWGDFKIGAGVWGWRLQGVNLWQGSMG